MTQLCPDCGKDNSDDAQTCAFCQSPLRNLLGAHVVLQQRYEVINLLGCGGMGAVYLALDRRLNRVPVAVKENSDTSMRAQQQFFLEATVLAGLDHPNLPRVIDHFIEPSGRQYLVMEYVEGDNLEVIVQRQGALPEDRVLEWANALLSALSYLHNQPQPIIHRDVKPSNIKVTPGGKVKLVDFGLVKVVSNPGRRTASVVQGLGTPEYAPPEQAFHTAHTDARSDVYSLGASLYHLLTGRAPASAGARTAAPAAFQSPRQLNPTITPRTAAAILKAMELEMGQRFQTAEDMRRALQGSTPVFSSTATRWLAVGGIIVLLVMISALASYALIQAGRSNLMAAVTSTPTRIASPTARSMPATLSSSSSSFTPVVSTLPPATPAQAAIVVPPTPIVPPTQVVIVVPPTAIVPSTPAGSGPGGCILKAEFIADLTIPDNTMLAPGAAFTKTWRVRNAGTCTWDEGYQLVFARGDQMAGPRGVALNYSPPGSVNDISVNLIAPLQAGTHTSIWQLQASNGMAFGNLTTVIHVIVTPTPTPTATASPTPAPITPPPQLILRDDFSVDTGWLVEQRGDSAGEVSNGVFRLSILSNGIVDYFFHSSAQAGDFHLRVDVNEPTKTTEASSAGVVFRHGNNGGYIFGISSEGNFEFKRKTPDGLTPIIDWTPSSAIQPGGHNVLEVRAVGTTFELYINGMQVGTATDTAFPAGGFGLYASTLGGGPSTTAEFDNLSIYSQ